MRTLPTLALATLVLCPSVAIADEAQITLAALIEAARLSHPTLARSPLIATALDIQRSQLDRAYLPRIALGGQASWQSDVTSIALSVPGVSITPPSKDQYKATIDVRQSLWDGGVTSGQKRLATSRAQVETAKVDLEWYQVRDRISQLYFAGLVQQELLRQAEVLERRLATILEAVRVAQRNGILIERDVLLVQARQLEARQTANDARAQLATVRHSLADLTGMTLTASQGFDVPPTACPLGPKSLRRPELAILVAQDQLLAAQDTLDEAADRPRVDAFATGGYGRPGLNALADKFDFYFIGGVQLTVPLTQLYARTRDKASRQLAVQRRLLDRQRDAVITQINVQLDTEREQVARLDAALRIDAELLDVRERARVITESQLTLGTATVTDFVNDVSQEDLARSKLAVHRAQRSLACQQLGFIAGEP